MSTATTREQYAVVRHGDVVIAVAADHALEQVRRQLMFCMPSLDLERGRFDGTLDGAFSGKPHKAGP